MLTSVNEDGSCADKILAGTGPSCLLFHAYGPTAKTYGSTYAAAMREGILRPYSIWPAGDRVSNLLCPPQFLTASRTGWTRLVRIRGLRMEVRMPSDPTPGMKVSVVFDGLNASEPRESDDILQGIVLWVANDIAWGANRSSYGPP